MTTRSDAFRCIQIGRASDLGDARRIYGAELESSYLLADAVTLSGSGSYIDFKYLDEGPAVSTQFGPREPTQLIAKYSWKSETPLDTNRFLASPPYRTLR